MEIKNATTTSTEKCKKKKKKKKTTVRWESRNIATQPGDIDDRKSEVLAFVVNAGMNIIANNFYIKNQERSFFV